MIKTLLFFFATLISLASYGQTPGQTQIQSRIVGTWELVYVAPSDALDTNPAGVTNVKLYFAADGKVANINPDQKLSADTHFNAYQFDGKQLTVLDGGKKIASAVVVFSDESTMQLSAPYSANRTFKKISGPDVELEPRSLQLIRTKDAPETVSYDSKDYSGLSSEKRLLGIWEVVALRNVPQDQLPPYGFLNDVWVITKDSIKLTLRYAQKTDTIPFTMKDGQLLVTDAVLGGRGAPLSLRPTFDKWGRLVLSRADVDIVLKLVSRDSDHVPAIPVKVVVTKLDGQQK